MCVCDPCEKSKEKNSNNFPKVCMHTHTYTQYIQQDLDFKILMLITFRGLLILLKNSAFCFNYLLLSMKKIKLYACVCVYVGLGIGSFMETKMTYKSYLGIQVSFYNCIIILSKSIKKGTVNNSTCATELELIVD